MFHGVSCPYWYRTCHDPQCLASLKGSFTHASFVAFSNATFVASVNWRRFLCDFCAIRVRCLLRFPKNRCKVGQQRINGVVCCIMDFRTLCGDYKFVFCSKKCLN